MRKSWICLLELIILNLFLFNFISAVRINEIETNPFGSDSGNEWIELYSENELSLLKWTIKNNDNESIILNQTFQGYFILNLNGQWLDNSDEKIFLYNNNELVDETILASDSFNDDRTWQYCDGNWIFKNQTKNSQNICSTSNPQQNNTQNTNQNNTQNQEASISLDMEWNEDEIINGEEFEIEVSVENLKNEKYNAKVWIEFEDNDTVISNRYGEDSSGEEVWKSGSYYIYNLFEGPGKKTEDIKLRIRESYKNFKGDAKVFFKLSNGEEISDDIEILKKEDDAESKKQEEVKKNNTEKIKTTNQLTSGVAESVIKLGNPGSKKITEKSNKNTGNNLIYESKNEKIKIYAIAGFAILCLGLVILVMINKIK